MRVYGEYAENGHALIKGLLDERVIKGLLYDIQKDLAPDRLSIDDQAEYAPVLIRPSFEIYGPRYTPLKFLLWGLTPIMEKMIKVKLLPTYCFFRVYRKGDICKIHRDRPACEHSLTFTVAYSDGLTWPFHVGSDLHDEFYPMSHDFEGRKYTELLMRPGDGVMYRGIDAAHGRMHGNPNAWSAHIFFHWVEAEGQHASAAMEEAPLSDQVQFEFAE